MFFDPQCKPANAQAAAWVSVRTQAQVCLDAIDLIEQRGWCQGTAEEPGTPDKPGPVCVSRALFLACPHSYVLRSALCNKLSGLVSTRYVHLWNDVPGRTKAEVVAMLRKAAAL
jgi:hypothetical protein